MLRNYAQWLIRYRWFAICLTLVIVGALATGTRFLSFTSDYRVFFDESNPQLIAFNELQETYARNDNVLIMLEPADGNVFSQDTLNAVINLTENAWQTPYNSRVDSISNYQYTYAEQDDLIVTDLIEDVNELDHAELERLKRIALGQPLLVNRLLSPSAHVTAVNITFQMPNLDEAAEATEVISYVDDLMAQVEAQHPNIKTYKTGVIVLNKAFPDASINDMNSLIPVAFLVILIGMFLLSRSAWGTLASLSVMIMSIAAAMGAAGWMGIVLSPPSASAPVLIITLAIADCVHFLVTFLQGMRNGADKRPAIIESIRLNFNPIFLTSLTTAVGFLSMNFSDSPPFHDLGTITAIGVVFAFALSIFFLPALIAVLPIKEKAGKVVSWNPMDALSQFVIKYNWTLLFGIGCVVVGLFAMIPKNELNDVFVDYFHPKIPFRSDTDHIEKHLTGMYFIDYSLDSKENSGINNPEYIKQLEEFEQWLAQQPEIRHVSALSETYRKLNRNMHWDDSDYYRIPDDKELAAQYLLMYEMSLPYGLDLNNQINIDKSATRVTVVLNKLSTKEVFALEKKVADWMTRNMPDMATEGLSPTTMFSHITQRNIVSMLSGTVLALLLISAILMVSLRSWKFGLISLIPNLVPAGMAFGIWAIFVGQVGVAISVVLAMTLGIVVDDTIHFLSKYLRARREQGMSTEDAIKYAFNTVGIALLITTTILTIGFLIIAQSTFLINANMGLLTAVTICIALIVDFLFLPPLLMLLDRDTDKSLQHSELQMAPSH